MSALAARRAAAAAQAVSASIPSPARPIRPVVATRESSPTLSSLNGFESGSEEDTEGGPGPSTKRQRLERSPKPRYFDNPNDGPKRSEAKGGKSRKVRRFSPSAPASEAEDGLDSSGDEIEGIEGRSGSPDGAEDMQGGYAARSASHTPRNTGSSATAPKGVEAIPSKSKFKPARGVNYQVLSSQQLSEAGASGEGSGAVVSLGPKDDLMLAGVFSVTPLQLSIELFSATLTPWQTNIPVFAPTSHPLPIISPSPVPSKLSPILDRLNLPSTFLLTDPSGSPRTVFLIRELDTGVAGLKGNVIPGFNNLWLEERGSWGLKGVHPIINQATMLVYPYCTPSSWSDALASLGTLGRNGNATHEEEGEDDNDDDEDPPILLVKGPKRSGKSTFARALLNKLLEKHARVAWLECDLGQGEFGCGGVVGIWIIDQPVLGPSFTHPRIPLRAHYLGTYTPLTCPDEYLAAIHHLLTFYHYEVQYPPASSSRAGSSSKTDAKDTSTPLVINTQGWVKGLGEELLRSIEAMSQPSHTFTFDTEESVGIADATGAGWTTSPVHQASSLPFLAEPEYATAFRNRRNKPAIIRTIAPAPISPLLARYTASDLRTLTTMSYFHSDLQGRWDLTAPLVRMYPWEVTLGGGGSTPADSGSNGFQYRANGSGGEEYSNNDLDGVVQHGVVEKVYMIGEGSEGILSEDLHIALNGSIVALLEADESVSTSMADPQSNTGVYVQGGAPPNLEETNFVALAIVRAVQPVPIPSTALHRTDDTLQQSTSTSSSTSPAASPRLKLHLLTPLPPAHLSRVRYLVRNGAIELPLCGMLDWSGPGAVPPLSLSAPGTGSGSVNGEGLAGVPWEDVPFLDVSGVVGVGGERRRFRRNLMRKGM